MPVESPIDDFERLADNSTAKYKTLLDRIAVAVFKGDSDELTRLTEELGRLISASQALADMMGRRRLVLEAEAAGLPKQYADPIDRIHTPVIPKVTFVEAFDDIVSRTPILAKNAEEVKNAYNLFHGFTLAKANSEIMVRKVQEIIARGIRDGIPVKDASALIQEVGDFTQAYAETVYRTNLSTAYTAGRFKQAQDEDIKKVIGAFEYMATMDSDVRPNHKAMNGFIALTDDPVWVTHAPPLGYNCRCSLRMVSSVELKRRGIELDDYKTPPSGGSPDKGFRETTRADQQIYGQ